MKIVFLMRQPHIFTLMAALPEFRGHSCQLFEEIGPFMNFLLEKPEPADLFICDYSAVQHEDLNLYNFEQEAELRVPLIFYNDPHPADCDRVALWRALNNRYLGISDFSRTEVMFEAVAAFVNSPRFRPYISVICTPQDYADVPQILRSASPTCCALLSYFYENLGRRISSRELAGHVWQDCSRNALYTALSRARKLLESRPELGLTIRSCGRGHYVMERV